MMKLFKAIFIPILIIVGLPSLLLAVMYDGSGEENMPIHLYTEDADAKGMVFTELSSAIDDFEDGVTESMVYELHQDMINTAIFEFFRGEEMNPDYLPTDDCDEAACKYAFSAVQDIGGMQVSTNLVGAWVDFEDDEFIINLYLEVTINEGFTYKTIVQTYFTFHDYSDRYELAFDKIKFGSLPIPQTFFSKIVTLIDNNVSSIDLSDQTGGLPIGELDLTTMSYSLDKNEMLAQLADNEESSEGAAGSAITQEVLSIIFEEELILFDLEEEKFLLTADVAKFKSDETDMPLYYEDFHLKTIVGGVEILGEFDPESFDPDTYLADMFMEYVFSSALVGGGFKIYEESFNKLIYYNADGFSDTRKSYEYTDTNGDVEVIDLGLKAIWFDLDPEEIYIYALFKVAGMDSVLKITAEDVSISDTELIFSFTEITFGEDDGEDAEDFISIIDLEVFNQMFLELGDVEFGEFVEVDGEVVLKITAEGLAGLMQDDTLNVTELNLEDGYIELFIEPANQELADALTAFTGAINDVFTDPSLLPDLAEDLDIVNPGPEQDVYNGVQDLQTAIDNDEDIAPEDIEELFNDFEQMDTDAQEAFLDTFNGLVPQSVYDEFQAAYDAQSGSSD